MRGLLRGFVLALLSLIALAALAPVHAQTRASEPLIISCQRDAVSVSPNSLIPALCVEFSLTDNIGAVFEDSDEMLRVDIEQRAIGAHRTKIEPKVSPAAVRNPRPTVSPPLLV